MNPPRFVAFTRWLGSILVCFQAAFSSYASFVAEHHGVAAHQRPANASYLYAGEQIDPDLGLYFLRARYLNQDKGRFWNQDTYEGMNEEPLSLHKYLYCHADPVNGVDPSGNMTLGSLLQGISIRNIAVGLVVATPLAQLAIQIPNMYGSRAPDPMTQMPKLDSALRILKSRKNWPAKVQPFVTIAIRARYRIYPDPSKDKDWGVTHLYGQIFIQTIHLNERSLQLSDELLASMLVHEAVHTSQYGGSKIGREKLPYEIQSEALRTLGISGSISSPAFRNRFIATNDSEWAQDVVDNMREAKSKNPAITP
jgi:RHS repeat-associated protein